MKKALFAFLILIQPLCYADRNLAEPNGPTQHMAQLVGATYIFENGKGACETEQGMDFAKGVAYDGEGNETKFCYALDKEHKAAIVKFDSGVVVAIPFNLTHVVTGAGHV